MRSALELGDQVAVAAGGIGLTLERAELAPDLAQQVLDAQQVGLGGVEPTLGLLLALAVLEDARGLLDDAAPVFGPGVEHGVDLTLADDHVLLAADAGVAEQLLDVEQAAGTPLMAYSLSPVRNRVRVTVTSVNSMGSRPAELSRVRLTSARPSADRLEVPAKMTSSIFWLRTELGACAPEHPRDGVDDVRLARAVRPDDHGDARLEVHGGGLGERLETFEGEGLQEHSGCRP